MLGEREPQKERSRLTPRWATEDPNPGEKVAEDKRLEELGRKQIAGKIDENLVEAAQTVRALEEGDEEDFYPIEDSVPDEPEERPSKRARADEDHAATNGSSNGHLREKNGFFSADTMDNLKFYAEMTRKQAEKATVAPAKTGMALIGGYGSGDESS